MATDPNITLPTLPAIPPVPSLKSMVEGVHIPMGEVGSLFQNPAKKAFDALADSTKGMKTLGDAMKLADPTLDTLITSTAAGIAATAKGVTDSLTAKVASISTELPITMSAQAIQDRVKSVDAILSKNLAAIPDQIQKAFPVPSKGKEAEGTPCPADTVEAAMAPITKANDMVKAANDAVTKAFDNTGPMGPLYTALNRIPGVKVSSGSELLSFLGSVPTSMSGLVTTILGSLIQPGSALVEQLKGAFTSSQDTTGSVIPNPVPGQPPIVTPGKLTTEFNKVVESANKAVTDATNFLTGSNVVSMIDSTNACVANVMKKVVNPAMTNPAAQGLQDDIKNKTVSLPGQESVAATGTYKPLEINSVVNKPGVTAADIVEAEPGKPEVVFYAKAELAIMAAKTNAQGDVVNKMDNEAATWYKPNVEDWKKDVDYNNKRSAAGYTEQEPLGTSTDPVALAEWKKVLDVWTTKRDYYNGTFVGPRNKELEKHVAMRLEYSRRRGAGKYPYTWLESRGIIIAEQNRTTLLDTTK